MRAANNDGDKIFSTFDTRDVDKSQPDIAHRRSKRLVHSVGNPKSAPCIRTSTRCPFRSNLHKGASGTSLSLITSRIMASPAGAYLLNVRFGRLGQVELSSKDVTRSAATVVPTTCKSRLVTSGWSLSALRPEADIGQRLSMSALCHQQTSVRGVRMPCLAPWRCREVSPSQHRLLGHHQSQEKTPPRQLVRHSG
jgi:hypothetical protein